MNNRETIEGVEGEWRTVTKADDVTVGQRVRYHHNKQFGYSSDPDKINCGVQKIVEKNGLAAYSGRTDTNESGNLFNGYWKNVQAFFPIAKPVKPPTPHKPRKPRKRPSKHERLLKALLKAMQIDDYRLDGSALTNRGRRIHYLSTTVANQLIAIKQEMEKKGTNV